MGSLNCITVETSASVANLGAGYDCLAMAVELLNTYKLYFESIARPDAHVLRSPEIQLAGEFQLDDQVKIGGDGNLFWAAFHEATEFFFDHERLEKPVRQFFIEQNINIPPKRGLGSSSSASVAGVLAAAEYFWLFNPKAKLLGQTRQGYRDRSSQDLLEWFATIARSVDNCPDNICASLVGGLTAAMVIPRQRALEKQFKGLVRFTRQDIRADLGVVALIPHNTISTNDARKVLPTMVPRDDAISNLQRTALTLACLRDGRYGLLREAMWDELHQERRIKELFKEPDAKNSLDFDGLVEDLTKLGDVHSLCIGGAGSSIVAFSNMDKTDRVAVQLRTAFARRAPAGWHIAACRPLSPRNAPANVYGSLLPDETLTSNGRLSEWQKQLSNFKAENKRGGFMFE